MKEAVLNFMGFKRSILLPDELLPFVKITLPVLNIVCDFATAAEEIKPSITEFVTLEFELKRRVDDVLEYEYVHNFEPSTVEKDIEITHVFKNGEEKVILRKQIIIPKTVLSEEVEEYPAEEADHRIAEFLLNEGKK